jgi:hypothetical protein
VQNITKLDQDQELSFLELAQSGVGTGFSAGAARIAHNFVTSRSSSRGSFGAIERDGDYGSIAVVKSPRDQPC